MHVAMCLAVRIKTEIDHVLWLAGRAQRCQGGSVLARLQRKCPYWQAHVSLSWQLLEWCLRLQPRLSNHEAYILPMCNRLYIAYIRIYVLTATL